MSGLVSTYARTSAVIKLTGGEGGDSCGLFGFDGSRPRLPLRLSVRTTKKKNRSLGLCSSVVFLVSNYSSFSFFQASTIIASASLLSAFVNTFLMTWTF